MHVRLSKHIRHKTRSAYLNLLCMINALHHFAERSLSEGAHNLIYGFKDRLLET